MNNIFTGVGYRLKIVSANQIAPLNSLTLTLTATGEDDLTQSKRPNVLNGGVEVSIVRLVGNQERGEEA